MPASCVLICGPVCPPERVMSRICLVMLLSGAIGTAACSAPSAETATTERHLPPAPEDGVVQIADASRPFIGVEAVTSAKISATVSAPARVDFKDGAVSQLGAPLDGRVVAVHVQIGQAVKKGDPLLTLDCPDAAEMRAAVESAHASLREARAALDRQTRMLKEGVGIERDRIAAETRVSELEAELTRVLADADFIGKGSGTSVLLRAPISGTVINRRASVGLGVQKGGDPLVEIGDSSALWIVADVFERDLQFLKLGTAAHIDLPSVDMSVDGQVVSIGTVVANGLRTAPIHIALASHGLSLRPGMYGRALLQADNSDITVPTDAILIKDGKESVVYVQQDDHTFVRRDVAVGVHVGDRIQVLSGLAPGDKVVVKGALLLDSSAEQLL